MRDSYTSQSITPELLEKLRRKAMIMEDEIAIEGGRQFASTGRLNDPGICEKSLEYENLCLDIEMLERILAERKSRTAKTGEALRTPIKKR